MAQEDGRDDEISALMAVDGIDTAKIAAQIAGKGGEPIKDDPPKTDPPKSDPPKTDPPKKDVPDPEAIRSAILNEMFGEQYKTVEEVKKANIPASLQELATLRQRTKELETQLQAKPKTQFVNEDIAKMNEFIRETGIKDVGIFYKLNATDVANMDPIDALVLQHIVDNPSLANKEPQVRRYIETRYNVDPKKVDAGDLTQDELEINLIGVASEGAKAKNKLADLKTKIKMPEPPKEDSLEQKKTKWTPEIETEQKAVWSKVSEKMVETYANLPIHVKGFEKPIANFAIPEEAKKELAKATVDYITSNQLEANEANIKAVATSMFRKIRDDYFEDIMHTVFERAHTMSEKEYLETYHNPSKKKNDDTPPGSEEMTDEAKKKRAFEAELER